MSDIASDALRDAQAELAAGRWTQAAGGFRQLLEHGEHPDALFGAGVAAFWLGKTEEALQYWERAFVAYRRRSDPANAVIAAVYLCLAYQMSLGNDAAATGWLGRASRLVERHRIDELEGWVLLGRAHIAVDTSRPTAGAILAREAYELAHASDDVDLELCSLSELGAALIDVGRVDEGGELLDEAMAGALAGEGRDRDAVVLIACRSIGACSKSGDFRRVTQWVRAADGFYRRFGSPHLYTTCRTRFGAILFAMGRWEQAEHELETALRIGQAAEPALHAEALASLAELRVAQGRLEEASRLLVGFEDQPVATYALAKVHLSRGEPAVAVSLLRVRLRSIDPACLESAMLVELLVEAAIAAGEIREAEASTARLESHAATAANGLVYARAEHARGRLALATGGSADALEHLALAASTFGTLGMGYDSARIRLVIAQALPVNQRETAIAQARTALATFDKLGARQDADATAALLRSLGVRAARGPELASGVLTRREREVLELLGEGLTNQQIGDRLFITRKTVEHHVASVLDKLGLSGRGEAAAYALRHVLQSPAAK